MKKGGEIQELTVLHAIEDFGSTCPAYDGAYGLLKAVSIRESRGINKPGRQIESANGTIAATHVTEKVCILYPGV